MKRIKKLFLLLCLVFSLIVFTACENTKQNSDFNVIATTQQTIPQTTEGISPENTIPETEPETKDTEPPTEPHVIEDSTPSDDDLVDISLYIQGIVIDLKYATDDNFTGVQIYNSDQKAMLRYGTVKKLIEVQKELNELGYTIVVWDAYRPTYAQFKLWDVCPDSRYVANPTNGGFSSHSRGNTIDISIANLDGSTIEMPTQFDNFSKAADRNYSDVSKAAAENSKLLEEIMQKHGFIPYSAEWWHFSDTDQYDVIKED